jgi:aspartate racemase
MKTIGVLGGLGPQATMDFEQRVHRVSQALIPRQAGTGYPPMIVCYVRHPPVVVQEDGTPALPIQPHPGLLEAARKLGAWADFLVIPSNGAHLVAEAVEQAAGRPVLSMIKLTLAEVQRRGWRHVGALGLHDPRIYRVPLAEMGLAYEILDEAGRAPLDQAIFALMEGRDDAATAAVARTAVDTLRARGVDGVIMGCTEIPLLLGDAALAPDLINPAELLAEATVRAALA